MTPNHLLSPDGQWEKKSVAEKFTFPSGETTERALQLDFVLVAWRRGPPANHLFGLSRAGRSPGAAAAMEVVKHARAVERFLFSPWKRLYDFFLSRSFLRLVLVVPVRLRLLTSELALSFHGPVSSPQ